MRVFVVKERHSRSKLKVLIMLHFIQTISFSALLASGTMLCGQNVMACGGRRACCQPTACVMPSCAAPAAPAVNSAPPPVHMDHSGHAQVGGRHRYQSGYQAPVAQPQYYAPASQYRAPAWSGSMNNYLPKADPRRFSRGI